MNLDGDETDEDAPIVDASSRRASLPAQETRNQPPSGRNNGMEKNTYSMSENLPKARILVLVGN